MNPWDYTYWELHSMAEGARPEIFQKRKRGPARVKIGSENIHALKSIVRLMGNSPKEQKDATSPV